MFFIFASSCREGPEIQCSNFHFSIFFLYSVIITISLPLVDIMKFSSKAAYYIGFMSFFLLIQVGVCILVIRQDHSPVYNTAVLSVIMVLLSCFYTGEDIFFTCTIAKLVKPDIQSFADGIRVFSLVCLEEFCPVCLFHCLLSRGGYF